MYEDMFATATQGQAGNKSKLYEQLTAEQQVHVTEFIQYLRDETSFSQNSVNSYKTYICQAMLKADGKLLPADLSSDQKSCVKKFRSWFVAEHGDELVERDDVEPDDEPNDEG